MLAYKVFNSGWRCRNLKYEVGKTYKMDGVPALRTRGFHAYVELSDCFNYYSFSPKNKVAVVDVWGFVKGQNTDEICGSRITIKKELTWHECLNLVNNGHSNNGHSNSGDSNSGHCNSGHYNSGRYNSGDYNSGDWNSGHYNSGDYNSGRWNSGNYNSGHYNSGRWNNCDNSSGFFNTKQKYTVIFNKETKLSHKKFFKQYKIPICLYFIQEDNETYKEAAQRSMKDMTEKDIKIIKMLPNFDSNVFFEIFGVRI